MRCYVLACPLGLGTLIAYFACCAILGHRACMRDGCKTTNISANQCKHIDGGFDARLLLLNYLDLILTPSGGGKSCLVHNPPLLLLQPWSLLMSGWLKHAWCNCEGFLARGFNPAAVLVRRALSQALFGTSGLLMWGAFVLWPQIGGTSIAHVAS